MAFLRDIIIVVLLSLFGGTAALSAQEVGSADIVKHPVSGDINTVRFLNTGFMNVQPLSTGSLFIAEHPQWRPLEELHLSVTDKSVQFKPAQLILPAALVAVSSFGTWNARAKSVNNAVRDGFAEWRGDAYHRFDDYVQYLPVVSYVAVGFTGAKARHNFKERLLVLGTSYIAMGIMVNTIKYTVKEPRPYNNLKRNSYPSGHTATAFMGAELVRREYGLGYGIAAYAVACGIGVMRMYNDRHWLNDVIAGAGIGILSAQIGYWMLPLNRKLFGMERNKRSFSVAASPFYDYDTNAFGGGVAIRFR